MSSVARRRVVLVIDDDETLGRVLIDGLGSDRLEVLAAGTGRDGLALCAGRAVDVVLLDQKLPDAIGSDLPPAILARNELTKIIFMTAFPSFDNALAAIRAGAHDYLCKPFELEEVRLSIERAFRVQELERIEQLHTLQHQRDLDGLVIAGERGGLAPAVDLARRAAATTAPVLLTGPTGSGKTLLARYIHRLSPVRDEPFIAVNCAALPESLAEAELLGFERGAFTGAEAPRRGVFEMAEGGSVLLDEVGAMPLALQAKLLGVLEDRCLRRVGGETQREVRARVLAATNRDLDAATRDGSFRSDLLFRLDVLRIELPSLAERLGDLPELVSALLAGLTPDPVELAGGELERLAAYPWPGNVRELRNVLERALILSEPGPLRPSTLLPRTGTVATVTTEATSELSGRGVESDPTEPSHSGPGDGSGYGPIVTLAELEREHIRTVLARLDGNLTRTAEALGIALSTLKRKVERHGLRRPHTGT